MNTIQIKENKQLNIQQRQNYPGSVASYDTQPGNEVGLFYNGPEHHRVLGVQHSLSVRESDDVLLTATPQNSIQPIKSPTLVTMLAPKTTM